MKINFDEKLNDKIVLCLGLFDTIHIGHRALIEKAKKIAVDNNCLLALTLFDDNASVIFKSERGVYTIQERDNILKSLGVDIIIVVRLSESFIKLSADEFCSKLYELYNIHTVCVGEDFTYGYNKSGNVDTLRNWFNAKLISTCVVGLIERDNEKISSNLIKRLLKRGDVSTANDLLGENYFVLGSVKQGRKQGRTIGFPTVNISYCNKFQIKEGVYLTKTNVDGKLYNSITSVGTHPTFNDDERNIETYILNFDQMIYEKEVTVYFYRYLRDIKKFDSIQELINQITKDKSVCENTNY